MNKNNFMQEFIILYATTDHAQIVFLITADKKFRKVQIIPQFLPSFEGLVIKENQRRIKEFACVQR